MDAAYAPQHDPKGDEDAVIRRLPVYTGVHVLMFTSHPVILTVLGELTGGWD
jgi:hypothetical protein